VRLLQQLHPGRVDEIPGGMDLDAQPQGPFGGAGFVGFVLPKDFVQFFVGAASFHLLGQ
jgi:hypothetical protein